MSINTLLKALKKFLETIMPRKREPGKDIFNEWVELRPGKLMDKRAEMPRKTDHFWKKRPIEGLQGICVHQTLGGDNPIATANYHFNHMPNGTPKPGAPSICYTFYIRKNGDIWWCNDLEDRTWSQGAKNIPGDENRAYVSIVVGGNFPGPGYKKGDDEPTFHQMYSLLQMVQWLTHHLGLSLDDVYGHYMFGKPACPGNTLMTIIEALNANEDTSLNWTASDWQYALVRLGYDLGEYGPRQDGVDGSWGTTSRRALADFQRANNLKDIGVRNKPTQTVMIQKLKEKFGPAVRLQVK